MRCQALNASERPASDPAKAAKRQKVELSVGDKGVFFTTANAGDLLAAFRSQFAAAFGSADTELSHAIMLRGSAVNAKRELQKQLDGELQKLLDAVQAPNGTSGLASCGLPGM